MAFALLQTPLPGLPLALHSHRIYSCDIQRNQCVRGNQFEFGKENVHGS